MRGLHNVVLWLILGAFSAIPASASSFTNFVGWGKGDENLESAFYPVLSASPRYLADTNWHFASDVWSFDFALAVSERLVYAGQDPIHPDGLAWDDVRVPWSNERLQELKEIVRGVVPLYINLENRDGGSYQAWFDQWDYEASPYNGTNYTLYLAHVVIPPNWTFADSVISSGPVTFTNSGTAFFEYAEIPTNFFDYTPARFLGATAVSFTNEFTAEGGPLPEGRTTEWTTLDYGWEGLMRALTALEDLDKSQAHGFVSLVDDDFESNFDPEDCGIFESTDFGQGNGNTNWLFSTHASRGCLSDISGGAPTIELGLIQSELRSWGFSYAEHYIVEDPPENAPSEETYFHVVYNFFEFGGTLSSHKHTINISLIPLVSTVTNFPSFRVYDAAVFNQTVGSAQSDTLGCVSTNFLQKAWSLRTADEPEIESGLNLFLIGDWMLVESAAGTCCVEVWIKEGTRSERWASIVDESCQPGLIEQNGWTKGDAVDFLAGADSASINSGYDITGEYARTYNTFVVMRPDFIYPTIN